ncbi:hypothetical protein OPV22_001285 [Ensete ventricosum]|uniref:OBG-type G domain-containing protein n=1 Tax=Ensete ventricosum TaxID=4639 RepID=A0AAV8RS10_ENSVE|nr:hypothetical protein OPV22_001285 [Ensete ventricosum]
MRARSRGDSTDPAGYDGSLLRRPRRRRRRRSCSWGSIMPGMITLLHMLMDERLAHHQPTSEELSIGKIQLNCQADAVFHLVDVHDKERKELNVLLSHEALANSPFLLLRNKIDIPSAESEEELCFPSRPEQVHIWKGKGQPCGFQCTPLGVFMFSVMSKNS